jgi:hypothetical protein
VLWGWLNWIPAAANGRSSIGKASGRGREEGRAGRQDGKRGKWVQLLDRKEEMSALVDQTISQLETLSQQFPLARALHIVLARLCVEKKHDNDNAISVLRRFVRNKGNRKDKDVSDADFNIAYYTSLKLAKETNRSKITDLEFNRP